MATRGRPIPAADIRALQRLREAGLSVRKRAHEVRVSPTTAQKYTRKG